MTPLRVASLVEGRLAGSSMRARPGPFSFQYGGLTAVAVGILLVGVATPALSGGGATGVACLLLLVFGLPHGALDIATIRRTAPNAQQLVVGTYLAAAAAMFVVWWATALAGLAIFYTVSIIHFADDWENDHEPFFGNAIALAFLSAPTILHGGDLQGLFVALTNDHRAALLADILELVAPVAIAVTLVGLATMQSPQRSIECFCGLVAMLILPPVIGFAVFFCLFHSPRHFREGWAALGPNVASGTTVRVAAMTLAGFGIAAIIYAVSGQLRLPTGVFAASMMTLSVLTVPHMLLQRIVESGTVWARSRQSGFLAA